MVMRTKKGIYLILAVLAMMAVMTTVMFTSSMSIFSSKYLSVGAYQTSVIEAELKFEQMQYTLQGMAKTSVQRVINGENNVITQNLPLDPRTGARILEENGITHYPDFLQTLQSLEPTVTASMNVLATQYNQVSEKNRDSYRQSQNKEQTVPIRRPVTVLPQNAVYKIGYAEDSIVLVPSYSITYVLDNPGLKAEKGKRDRSSSDATGQYHNFRNIVVPLTKEEQNKLYPYLPLLEMRNRAYSCVQHDLYDGKLDMTEECTRYSGLNITRTDLQSFTFSDTQYIFRVNVTCVSSQTQDRKNQIKESLAKTLGLKNNLSNEPESQTIQLPGRLRLRFSQGSWQYSEARDANSVADWKSVAYYDAYTDSSTIASENKLLLSLLAITPNDLEQGSNRIYEALKNYDYDSNKIVAIYPDGKKLEIDTSIFSGPDAIQSAFTNTQVIEYRAAYDSLLTAYRQSLQETDKLLEQPSSCDVYQPKHLQNADIRAIVHPEFSAFLRSQNVDLYNSFDLDGDANVQVNEILESLDRAASGTQDYGLLLYQGTFVPLRNNFLARQ